MAEEERISNMYRWLFLAVSSLAPIALWRFLKSRGVELSFFSKIGIIFLSLALAYFGLMMFYKRYKERRARMGK